MTGGVECPPTWAVHLPPGIDPSQVDLLAGGSLPGAWIAAWGADGGRVVLRASDGACVSAAELEARTATAARRFFAAGLAPGQRVLLCAGTSVEFVVAFVGALRAGLAVVPANSSFSPADLRALVGRAAPALALVDDPGRLAGVPIPVSTVDLDGLPGDRAAASARLDEARADDTALLVYTSGTTGRPKAVPLSHANLLASAHAVRLAWRWEPDDNLALCLPLFHVHGLGVGLTGTLISGACATLLPRFEPASLAEVVTSGVAGAPATLFFGVPTMYYRLAQAGRLAALRPLRLAVSGSAPLPADLHEMVRLASGQAVLERYGMTETVMLVSNPYDGQRRPGAVGFPLPGVEVRLAPVPGGAAEIQVRGPNVITGYLNGSATIEAFTPDGWFRTGDLGTLDDDGYLKISGRATELIITGGYNVYPREVEDLLRHQPGVADCAVAGMPSAEWGETVVAFIVPDGSSDPAAMLSELDELCAKQLVSYKRPRQWRVVREIPRNAVGKVLRRELTEQ